VDNWQPDLSKQELGCIGVKEKLFFKQLIQTGGEFENDVSLYGIFYCN
jgi:hypothetical protein